MSTESSWTSSPAFVEQVSHLNKVEDEIVKDSCERVLLDMLGSSSEGVIYNSGANFLRFLFQQLAYYKITEGVSEYLTTAGLSKSKSAIVSEAWGKHGSSYISMCETIPVTKYSLVDFSWQLDVEARHKHRGKDITPSSFLRFELQNNELGGFEDLYMEMKSEGLRSFFMTLESVQESLNKILD